MTTTPATTPVAVKDRPRRKPPQLPPSNAAALAALRAGDKKPLGDPSRKESQDKVGNGAVAAGLARSPATDPKFAVLKKDVAHKKHTVARSHPPADKEATSAQAASVPPKDDEVAQGKTANAEKMNEAKPKEFDKDAFVKAVEKAIAEKAPKNLEQADEFAGSGKPAEIKAEVQGRVGEGKTDSAEQIADTTAAPPDTAAAETKQVVPMAADRPPGTPATPDPAKATPDKLPPSATDLSAGPAGVDREMAGNQVTEQQLRKSNEPAFGAALKDKKTAEKHSETAPPELRKNEAQQLRQTTAQAKGLGTAAMGAIAGQRVRTGRQVGGGKQATKATDEEKRAQVTAVLQKVFDTMKTEVEGILTGLDKLVDDQFTQGEKEARDAFTAEHRQKMDEYKDRRYGGPLGALRWGKDKLFGLPAEADLIFVVARDHYVKRMRGVISAVADTIGRELTRAKQRIAKGRDELQSEVRKLPKDLQALGKQAAAGFADKFDELTQSVDDKSTELVDTLATKYTDAVKAVDDEIAAEKEKNKGLVDKALDGIKGVIKTILELKDLLLGVLAKAAQAVMGILRDPIGFLGNLVSAVGGGLKLFMQNAGRHLQQGVLSWLLGTAATAGITLPTSFDVMGILLLIASLIGLSWANLRSRLARKLPKEAMTAIEVGEHALPLVLEVRKRGIRALWDDLKARVGDLKKNLIDNLVSYLLPTIIIAGVTWIISLFNPASAFIRACKMIIDIIRFIVTNGKQIIEFVNTVLDAVIAIAKGGSGGVPALVEKALARSIPVLIGALAALLGIGGIASKVKEIFQKLARPVNKAIDWVVDKIVGLAKKVWAKVKALAKKLKDKAKAAGKKVKDKFGKKKDPEKDKKKPAAAQKPEEDKQKRLDKAVRELEPKIMRLVSSHASGIRLRAQLLVWRVTHRLSRLWVERLGPNLISVRAQINPTADVVRKVFTAEKLHELLLRVGQAMISRPKVAAKVQAIRDARARGEGKIDTGAPLRQAQSPAVEAAAMQQGAAPMPIMRGEHIRMGDQEVSQQQMFGPGPGPVIVHGAGPYAPDPEHPEKANVSDIMKDMEAAGLPPAVIRQGMHDLLRNKPLGPEFANHPEQARRLAAVTRLMFVVEGARSPHAFPTGFMAWETAGRRGTTVEGQQQPQATTVREVVTSLHPMSPPGAVGHARDALLPPGSLAGAEVRRANVEAMYEKELNVTVRYLEVLMAAEKPLFKDEQECEAFLRDKFEAHLIAKLTPLLLAPGE
ncbi:phage tail protein [Amycolatopsis pretoriensis]|uniref:phage tail protein n=1 Tax=Amycolatopsis pretoriensis TaxID=218821 RepID=UPI001FC97B80|nr:hypothetical protein [Amycolatopsis pretoriensis]